MSLASSRRGRPNNRRDSDADLALNTIRVVGSFRSEIYASLGELPSGVFEILVDCVSSPDVGEFIELDDTLSIPDDEAIERGPVPVFKYQLFKNRTAMLEDGYVVLDDDAAVLDLNCARIATESEIREALAFEPEPIKPPAPVAPVYKIIPRTADDVASRLGFRIEPGEHLPVKLAAAYTVVGFHLPSAQIIGRIQTSLTFPPHSNAYLELSVYDAAGDRRLYVEMTSPTIQLDQLRLEAGDHLLVFRCKNGALEGSGSYHHPNARVVASLPTRRDIDTLLWGDQSDMAPGIRCAVPCFEWTSR